MWALLPLIMLTLTLCAHCTLMRFRSHLSQVFCFLLVGIPIGFIHIGLSFFVFGYTEKLFASILVYAASCQLILNLVSLAANGVSVSVLDQLSKGPTELHTLDEKYSPSSMVSRRIRQLQVDGFLIQEQGKLQLPRKGQVLVHCFLMLRSFFGHKPLPLEQQFSSIHDERPIADAAS